MNPKAFIRLLALAAVAAPSMAFAVLGSDVSSLQYDRANLKASMPRASKAALYTVHEMTAASGAVVREYEGGDGKVFAVAWNGRVPPDLHQLMGEYFDIYASAAARTKHSGHSHLQIRQGNLVVMSRGHMRAFAGVAYLPGKLPAGVQETDIK
jgi:Protein of unknown function (DUF2844)